MFPRRLGGLVLVIGASCLVSLGVAFLVLGNLEPVAVGIAHMVGLVVGVVSLRLVHGSDVTVETVLAATGTRAAGTCLVGGLLFGLIPDLHVNVYVLSIAASYFAVLVYETWLLSNQLKRRPPVVQEDSAEGCPPVDDPSPSVG